MSEPSKCPVEAYPPVHPRVCGEQNRHDTTVGAQSNRFIPACAGNSRLGRVPAPRPLPTVHPRVCGGTGDQRSRRRLAVSRSVHPRVCGEQRLRSTAGNMDEKSRFIPACAGNRSIPSLILPRGFGRFIPACAGNREDRPGCPRLRGEKVHPRVCGEQPGRRVSTRSVLRSGSSPRVRGTAWQATATSGCGGRFIPACAGNSVALISHFATCSRPVHPARVRGTATTPKAIVH